MRGNILIVGAGPAGMVLACMLAKNGVKVKIVDKRQHSSSIPRAINIASPVLKIFDDLGIGQRIGKNGLKLDELNVYWNKNPFININYKYYKPDYPYFFHLEQSKIECYLSDKLQSHGVHIKRAVSVNDIKVNPSDIHVNFSKLNGETWGESFNYVIGCDGGNSTVRELAGIGCAQEKYPAHFMLIDGEIIHQFKNKINHLHYYLSENGYLIVAPLANGKCRMIASVKGVQSGKQTEGQISEKFKEILLERAPSNLKLNKILWGTSGNYFHRIADVASKGNVFLAGDALHQFSPVGGANMNVGVQDASSLGERLLNEIRGKSSGKNLREYSNERLYVAWRYIKETASMTRLLTRYESINMSEHEKYLPNMKNRKYIKHTLPEMFSGDYFIN